MAHRSTLLVALLALCVALSSATLIKQTLEAQELTGWRRDSHRRYFEDPLGLADTIYSTLLTVAGQNYRVIMDTGSATVFLIGRNCTKANTGQGCQYATNFYDGSGSTFAYSFNECGSGGSINYGGATGVCRLSAVYGDGSYVYAVGIQDTATIGPYTGNIKFGMAYNTSTSFVLSGTDGIWGLGRYLPSSYVGVPGPFYAATTVGLTAQFATCFTSSGGELHLGGYDSSYASSGISWFPWLTSQAHYQLTLATLTVNGNTVGADGTSSIIFDSGSTVSYFPSTVFSNMISQIQAACPTCNTNIFTSGGSAVVNPDSYPDIVVSFVDASNSVIPLTLTGRQYLRPTNNAAIWAGGFFSSNFYLFGVSFIRNWYLVFDVANDRLGIGSLNSAQCSGALPPTGPLKTISPSTPKPPTSSGTPPPTSPGTPPTATTPPSPDMTSPDSPTGNANSASISLLLAALLALFALLF